METHTSLAAAVSSRDRWLITALLGLGLITFAIDASNTRLVLPQMMTSLRVELYQSHWVFTAPGIARTVMTASTGWLSGWLDAAVPALHWDADAGRPGQSAGVGLALSPGLPRPGGASGAA